VERIAMSLLDLLIEEHDDLRTLPGAPTDQGRLSGLVDPDNDTIWLDRGEARRSPRRRRFTIAHELGHWQLHVPADRRLFYDRAHDISDHEGRPAEPELSPPLSELRQREREADAFARELLMPERLVAEQARATGCNLPLLAERFDVSAKAIRLRLRLMGMLPAGMR
jgi:Zn-dependent peptidase ImmA (M78 family)